ncbi:hypothetical protein HZS61_001747 [Fusarium oxysporum f. sp. conglutinans]|uniref:Glycosyl hydrolases family 2 sugar binding domain-containing protein n=1 Tax=Fusarium oxysporum f. sp. conglutinans TaxID=100902 RepID=A0A8H6LTL9_FUSOX|nr:hypothetical protein HZS61_001747 [Fusarium oxysporum f. sp. conglutinans]KAG6991936.1 hypothetical protein FocnCong_v017728 [Fusarium oxysporum f. sp. conglutinans]KAI8417634.1 hypothetical protein FOFC_00189 [Fusarium oxysporum]
MRLSSCQLLASTAAAGVVVGQYIAPSSNNGNVIQGFEAPATEYRPKFRYWLPDADVDHDILKGDVQDLKKLGAGGLEFLPFYNYGFGGVNDSKLETYAFGKPAFRDVLQIALEATKENGLSMDVVLGASQGQGVPSKPLTPGLAVQLVYGKTTVKGGAKFDGALPAAEINWNENLGYIHPQEKFGDNQNDSDESNAYISLHEKSLVDLTKYVKDGKLTWTAPKDYREYVLFAHYERYTNQRSADGVPTDVIANDSWVTDHFSATGAKLAASFWEKNLLTTQIRQLLKEVGKHTWEDSMEIQASLYWSPGFLDRFKSKRGYNVIKYLPLLFHKSTSFQAEQAPYNTTFYLDGTPDNGQSKYLQDYRLTLNEGYQEYLQTLENWAASLGLSHSCQVGYNIPLDVLADVPVVSTPELESLGFTTPDQMYQFVGPAHLGRRNIISTEIGAVATGAYSQTIPSLVNLFHEAFAGGVNAMMIHGMTYTGEQVGSTWPGYTPFQYIYTELWSPKQPAWKYMSEMIDYTARNQFVLQQGVAKKDLVFYLYKDPYRMVDQFNGTDLRASGYTYEYLSPANFGSKAFKVSNKVLDPSGAGYRALVLDQQQFITAEASKNLVELADAGLPIVVIGSLPSTAIGSKGQDIVSKNISKLKRSKYSNIAFVKSADDVLNALGKLSVKPRVTTGSDAAKNLYTVWRSDKGSDYLLLFNQGSSSTFEITAEVEQGKIPYKLNAWTGQQVAMASFKRSSGKVTFQVSLKEGQTAIVAFTSGKSKTSIVTQSENVIDASYSSDGKDGIFVLLGDTQAASLTLSNGKTKKIPVASSSDKKNALNIDIGNWNLTLESWVPGHDETKSASVKKVMKLGTQKVLKPWSEISGAQNVSGVGTYTATFQVPRVTSKDSIAVLQLGPVLNTIRAWVNDKQLPTIDIYDAQIDVSDYLVAGRNTIRVEVASTLFNAVKARVDYVKANGVGPAATALYTFADWQKHGLIGPVSIKSLCKVSL